VPLMGQDSEGKPIDYKVLADSIEEIRQKYINSAEHDVNMYIIGFAKLTGDLIDGLKLAMLFFLVAAIIAVVIIYSYTRCMRSSLLVLMCSVVAVVWQLGAVTLLGYELDPFSMLVPFLVVAIGVSHGAQKMNGIMQDIGRGTDK